MMKTTEADSKAGRLSVERCHQARVERDPAFDGRFFFAVNTTGIYCRPVCSARRALAKNVQYFESAASAASAGFRPCLRCRPERAPAVVGGGHALVGTALQRIQEGALDDGSVADLAQLLRVGERRLRRLFDAELGASPARIAAHRRLLVARQILEATETSVIDVAFASGFNSLRRFNEAFKDAFGVPPRAVRDAAATIDGADLALTLGVRSPFDGLGLLKFLALRSIPGVEHVKLDDGGTGSYRRTFQLGKTSGVLNVEVVADDATSEASATREASLNVHVRFAERPKRLPNLLPLVERVKHIFDLGFDPSWLAEFKDDATLGKPYMAAPGIRVPGCLDPFELSVRAVLGQQVTVAGATTLSGRIAQRWGTPIDAPSLSAADGSSQPALLFPTAEALVDQPLEEIGLPKSRANTLRAVARFAINHNDAFSRDQELGEFERRFCELPGIGPWTAHYVAMRALHARDAFLKGDLVLRKALALGGGKELPSALEVERRSESWRPFRAYAGLLLWRAYGEDLDKQRRSKGAASRQ